MPTYVYRVVRGPGDSGPEETFEIRQSMHDAPLTKHPETGEPVERVICAPQIAKPTGDSQIAAAGFTKYKRTSDGSYERLAGSQGPERLNPHES
jgi:hypothetical protein